MNSSGNLAYKRLVEARPDKSKHHVDGCNSPGACDAVAVDDEQLLQEVDAPMAFAKLAMFPQWIVHL